MSATKNECNWGSPSIYRPEANAWISKRSSDLDYKGKFALIKIGFLQSSFYEVMWSSLCQGKPCQYGNTNILISVLDHSFAIIMEFSTIFVNF